MYIYIYIIYTVDIHIQIYMYIYIYMYVCMCIHVYIYIHTCIYIYTHTCIYTHIYIYIINIYIYICIQLYKHLGISLFICLLLERWFRHWVSWALDMTEFGRSWQAMLLRGTANMTEFTVGWGDILQEIRFPWFCQLKPIHWMSYLWVETPVLMVSSLIPQFHLRCLPIFAGFSHGFLSGTSVKTRSSAPSAVVYVPRLPVQNESTRSPEVIGAIPIFWEVHGGLQHLVGGLVAINFIFPWILGC